jgi:ubiquinone/menaquinone biosynthesis C-methylase UbiE
MATFDERARDWDTPERIARAAEVASAIRGALDLSGTERMIDVGAGTGLLGLALVDDVGSVTLADPSAGMIEVANEKLAGGDLPTVHAVRHDLIADPTPEKPFDLAVSMLVLHHIEDTAAALAGIHALLAPSGRIALADLDTEDGTFHSPEAEGIHHQGFDRGEIERLAAQAGFADVATRTAMRIADEDGGGPGYPVFLLTGRRAGS